MSFCIMILVTPDVRQISAQDWIGSLPALQLVIIPLTGSQAWLAALAPTLGQLRELGLKHCSLSPAWCAELQWRENQS